ncbi:ATPase [Alteromonas phage vB_AcoS-R7M]|uniref:ATPase n=1 Tax=Alteromonas phage vB_AcoS-R7M TaxID=2729541 RepID=A0A6M3YN94_9CAUD|nr:Sak4-like ssDNA annealing protein [Alteromonas phage vB_AcoS-R7M]QJI53379.1 ATPase [Alteromonas phage vB_AcoS-R7M]
MALKFTTSANEAKVNGVKVLVYGPAGTGKTVMSSTAPGPILLSAESGLLSLKPKNLVRLYGENNPSICYDIPTIQISSVQDLTEAYNWCSQSKEANQFQTVCIDSLSEIAEVVLNNAKRQVKDPRQAYGELLEKMETTIRLFRDLQGKHVYMTSKLESYKDANGVVKNGPSMPGSKLGNNVPYFYDEVFRLGTNKTPQGESYRFLQTQPDLQYDAKDRSGALDSMEPPNLTHVFNKILGD